MRELVLALVVLLTTHNGFAREIVDATGAHVKISDHPTRIVTLAPSLAELASDFLGMDLDHIVGVTESTDYPPALKKVPSVGQYQRLNLEKIVSLKPDLILATEDGNSQDQINHLREQGLPVLVLKTNHFTEIEGAMKQVAEALGVADESQRMLDRFRLGIEELRARGKRRSPRKKVLIELDDDPLVVVGKESFLNEALELVGASNIYHDANTGYPRPSKEDVVSRNPEIILVPTFGTDTATFMKRAEAWSLYSTLSAVRSHSVKVIYGDSLLRPSMRLLDGLSLLEKAIYGPT